MFGKTDKMRVAGIKGYALRLCKEASSSKNDPDEIGEAPSHRAGTPREQGGK
jgi:hypothetical protein